MSDESDKAVETHAETETKRTLVISFLVVGVFGCDFIFSSWSNISPWAGFIRCLVFVVIIGGVHFVGFRMWMRQEMEKSGGPVDQASPAESHPRDSLKYTISSSLMIGLIIQLVLFVLTALLLDGGRVHRAYIITMIGYWVGAVAILFRHRQSPTIADHMYLRYGILAIAMITPLIARIVYRIIGESPLNGLERLF